jgi:hypothetical protein
MVYHLTSSFIIRVAVGVAIFTHHPKEKADVVEHPDEVFDHVGLLINGPPGTAGLPFS